MLCAARERSEHSNGCTSRKNRDPRYVLRRGPAKSLYIIYARVAELADAQDLKSCCSDTVPVRFRSRARFKVASNPSKSRVWSFFHI